MSFTKKNPFKPSLNWFLVFIPATLVLEHAGGIPAPLVFFSAALAILPIASLIVKATEQIAARTGDAIGGLLNATFGNAPELIITVVALKAGLFDMVLASLIGASCKPPPCPGGVVPSWRPPLSRTGI